MASDDFLAGETNYIGTFKDKILVAAALAYDQ